MVLIINKYFGNISRISKNAVAKNKWQLLKLQNKVQMESYCSKLNLSCSFSIDQMVSHFQIVLPSRQPQEPGAGTRERREPIKIWLDPSAAGMGWGGVHCTALHHSLSSVNWLVNSNPSSVGGEWKKTKTGHMYTSNKWATTVDFILILLRSSL